MKIFLTPLLCLLCGLAVGFIFGYRYYDRHITDEAVKQLSDDMESADCYHAAEATCAIELIESGDRSNVVQMLSIPIANITNGMRFMQTPTGSERCEF